MCYHGNGKQRKAKLTTYIFAQSFVAQSILHFRNGINLLSHECTQSVHHTHKMRMRYKDQDDLPLHIFLPHFFLQPQWTSSLQLTAAALRVTHSGCICVHLCPRVQHQSVEWDEAQAPLDYLLVITCTLLGRSGPLHRFTSEVDEGRLLARGTCCSLQMTSEEACCIASC